MASKATTPAPSPGIHPLQLLAGSPALPPSISSPASPSAVQAANLAQRRPSLEIVKVIKAIAHLRETVVEVREHQKYGNKRVTLVLEEVAEYSTKVASYSDEVDGYRDEVNQCCQKVDENDQKVDKLSEGVDKLIDAVVKVGQNVAEYNQKVDHLSQKVDKLIDMVTESRSDMNTKVIPGLGVVDRLGLWLDGTYGNVLFNEAIDCGGDYGDDDMVQ